MARIPEEVLTRTKKGEIEVRSLIDPVRVAQVSACGGAVVGAPDLDDSESADGLRDEVHEGPVLDLFFDDAPILLEDPDIDRRCDHGVALLLDPLQVLRSEIRGLEINP